MCGRFNLRANLHQILEQFFAKPAPQLQYALRYNAAPTQNIAAVRIENGERILTNLRWGLVPVWAKDIKFGFSGINARAEPSDYETWLDPTNENTAELQKLLDPFPADRMSAKPVSTYVNNAKHEGEECLSPPEEA